MTFLQKWQQLVTPLGLVGAVMAGVFIVSLPHLYLPTGSTSLSTQNELERTITILVADFEGAEPQTYRITEKILNQLRNRTERYSNVKVIPLKETITERDGKQTARKLGKQKNADIVIWGWYSKTKEAVATSVNFEMLMPSNQCFPHLDKQAKGEIRKFAPTMLDRFEIQGILAGDLSYLALVALGTARYSVGDWNGAIDPLSEALRQMQDSPSLDPAAVYFYRATVLALQGRYDQAVSDLTQAIKRQPTFAEAYYTRGDVYINQQKYGQAIVEYTQAIKLQPEYACAYNNRGIAYSEKQQYSKAINDFTQAIKIQPGFIGYYLNRGSA